MATTVDTLVVRIEADMKDMRRALRRVEGDVSRSTKKMSGAFGRLGQAMKVAVAAVVVRQGFIAGKAMVDLASDIEEMQGKSKVVFGRFRSEVVTELTAFGDAVGRSSHELEGMASTVQDTFVPMGFARGEAAKLSVELTKLAVDTASFNNASDTDTIKAFQSALVGNHETVRRFGVVITQATLDQELFTMGVEGGVKAATNAEKVQARLNLITKGVADAQGDAARTSGSYANTVRSLKAEFSELAGGLGKIVLPALTGIIAALAEGTRKAKNFLIAIGIIKEDDTKELAKIEAQIDKVTISYGKALVSLQGFKKAQEEGNQFADSGTQENIVASLSAELSALEMKAHNLRKTIKENTPTIDTVVPDGTGADDTGAPPKLTPLEEQNKAYKDLITSMETVKLHEEALRKARKSGDKEEIENALAHIELTKAQAKFDLLEPEQRKALASIIARNLIQKEALAKADADEIETEKVKADALEKTNQSIERGIALGKEHFTVKEELKQQAKDLVNAYTAEEISLLQLRDALELIKEKKLELDPVYAQMKDRIQSTADAMTDSLTQMVMDGKINFDTMKDMFKDMVRQMIADALKAQVIKPLLGGIFGGIGGAIGGPIGTAFTAVGTNLGKAATGGSLQSGNPYLVGERGPELIVPSSAGTIMNNHNTKNALGGGGGTVVNQTINVQSGVAQTVRAEMISLLPRFKQDTMNAVVDAKRRGGAFGQAFG